MQFLFEAATANCVNLATDRHGCCVLQKCLSHSTGDQRRCLVYKITSNALILCQDQFGYSFFPLPSSVTVLSFLIHMWQELNGYLNKSCPGSYLNVIILAHFFRKCLALVIYDLKYRYDLVLRRMLGKGCVANLQCMWWGIIQHSWDL